MSLHPSTLWINLYDCNHGRALSCPLVNMVGKSLPEPVGGGCSTARCRSLVKDAAARSWVLVPPPRFPATGGELLSQLARFDVRLGCHWIPTPTPRLEVPASTPQAGMAHGEVPEGSKRALAGDGLPTCPRGNRLLHVMMPPVSPDRGGMFVKP